MLMGDRRRGPGWPSAIASGLLAMLAVGLLSAPAAARATPPPLSAFARLPAIERAVISPDGSRVALLGGPPGERTIFIGQVDGGEQVTIKLGQSRVRDIRWLNDAHLLIDFSVMDKGVNYANGQEWAFEVNTNIIVDVHGQVVRTPVTLTDRPAPEVTVTGSERLVFHWADPLLDGAQTRLSATFAGRDVRLADWSGDRTRIVARVTAPASPLAWYLYDGRTRQASALGESYPELAGAVLGTTRWITYRARDGLEIPAYLTLPPDTAPGARPPLIVMPHDGPVSRDDAVFDWWVQALATRGYAVLQPQFRGSSGLGRAFVAAGVGEWGGKMQSDLVDGVQALVEQGLADPTRVAIVGAGYGGYAAQYGAVVYPAVYRCAVSVNGVSNLGLLLGLQERVHGRDESLTLALEVMLGDPKVDGAAFRKASPVFQVSRQAAPLLLIHADEDTTVPIDQSRAMQRALKGIGKPADLVVLAGDDHYLSSTASRLTMLESMFGFLGRCLPVGP